MKRIAGLGTALILAASNAYAVPMDYADLVFQTSGQSLWDSGEAFILNQSTFLGAAWNDQQIHAGGIVGGLTQITPAIPATYSPYIPAVYSPAIPSHQITPAIPSVCVLGVCTPYVPAVYSPYIPPQLITPAIPSVQLTPYVPATYIDTSTGAEITGTSSGRVGLELGLQIDSGSVDATVSYAASLDIPDATTATLGQFVSLNPGSALAGSNSLATHFSDISLSADAVMQLSGSIDATGCFLGAGCTSGGTSYDINKVAPIVSLQDGAIKLFGQNPSDLGLPGGLNGFPQSYDIAGLATVTAYYPQPDSLGGLNPATGTLQSTGQDDLLDLILDLDNIVATSAGVPGLFGDSVDVGPLGTLGFDIINVEMGPTIDLKQDFELTPTLWVNLAFDQAVQVGSNLVSQIVAPWSSLPDLAFLSPLTHVTPTFFLDATLKNDTSLDFNLDFGIDLLQIYYDFGLLGADTFGIGNVLSRSVDLFESPAFYSNQFSLGGFNLIQGQTFAVDLSSPVPPVNVPEPMTLSLLLAGLAALLLSRRGGLRRSPQTAQPA